MTNLHALTRPELQDLAQRQQERIAALEGERVRTNATWNDAFNWLYVALTNRSADLDQARAALAACVEDFEAQSATGAMFRWSTLRNARAALAGPGTPPRCPQPLATRPTEPLDGQTGIPSIPTDPGRLNRRFHHDP